MIFPLAHSNAYFDKNPAINFENNCFESEIFLWHFIFRHRIKAGNLVEEHVKLKKWF